MTKFFVNCDWGTTHFRLRLASLADASIAGEYRTDEGVAEVARRAAAGGRPAEFETVLRSGLRELAKSFDGPIGRPPVVICGMAGSSVGWHELPYAHVPWRLDGSDAIWRQLEPLADDGGLHRVLLLSGVRTPHDVMRGEETQALGLFRIESVRPFAERAVVILPGTHSKHLQVTGGAITGFQTFMTGELFDVLGRHSILRHSIGEAPAAADDLPAEDLASFLDGASQAGDVPLSAALFRVRTRQVLDGARPEANRSFLSGVLVGSELAALRQTVAPDVPIVLAAPAPLASFYAAACQALGLHDRLAIVEASEVERLSALGQACFLRRMGLA